MELPLSSFCSMENFCGPVGRRRDHFTVDDRRAGADVPGIVGDLAEAFGPVVAAAGEDPDGVVVEMKLDAVAVELDFVEPALAGTLSITDASDGSMKPGNGALTPIAAGFLGWKATSRTPHNRTVVQNPVREFVPMPRNDWAWRGSPLVEAE